MAAFPVYRTYVDAHHVTEQDREILTEAIEKARRQCPECRPDMDLITHLLLSVLQPQSDPSLRRARQHFLMRFQQFTGPAMAKGFEDTLLYVYNRFLSLNEVGGDPQTFGLSLDRFHGFHQRRARHWPHAMNATSTHDSKRGEDVRARLNVLSEIPQQWRQAVTRWADMNERHKQRCDGILAPQRNDEYLLYQTLVGALPFDEDEFDSFPPRIRDYMIKSVREAKTYSNWVQPDEPYEGACLQFIDKILDHSPANRFWADFLSFQRDIAEYGIINSLAQTTLKMTCPGLPDFYQGTELWDLSLVDPDNRRPVDFAKRAGFLGHMKESLDPPPSGSALVDETLTAGRKKQLAQSLWEARADGRIKLFLIHRGLQARRANRDLFETGDYLPASVAGSRAEHVIAFFRLRPNDYALTVVPRFVTSLAAPGAPPTGPDIWEDTRIRLPASAPATWRDAITGDAVHAQNEIYIDDILTAFPVAILLGKPADSA
jgi:(1->4)-alpha-D-glucan 1-alpha-D-glucosylmutase